MENSKKSCQWQEKLTEWYKAVKVVVSDIFYERHRWHVRRYQGRQASQAKQSYCKKVAKKLLQCVALLHIYHNFTRWWNATNNQRQRSAGVDSTKVGKASNAVKWAILGDCVLALNRLLSNILLLAAYLLCCVFQFCTLSFRIVSVSYPHFMSGVLPTQTPLWTNCRFKCTRIM